MRVNAYRPRPPRDGVIPGRHDHVGTMIFELARSRCTACGATWQRVPDDGREVAGLSGRRPEGGAWICTDPGRWPR